MNGRTEIAGCGVRRDAVAKAERGAPNAESSSTRPPSPPDRLPPRRGGGSSPHTYAVSAVGRVGPHPFAHALLVTIALLLSGALAPPAAAQEPQVGVLVSNLEHRPDISDGYASGAKLGRGEATSAQPFYVVAGQKNYTLKSVDIPIVGKGIAAADIDKLSVSIWYSDSWDYKLVNNEHFTDVGFVGCPHPCEAVPLGDQFYTLENPSDIADPPDNADATTATFTAPEGVGVPLLAGQTYAVVVSYDKHIGFRERPPYWQLNEIIVRVDGDSEEGWDIPNETWCSPKVDPLCNNASDTTWETNGNNVHRLGVNGYAGWRFADDDECPETLSPPVSVRAYPTLPGQIHLGWWSPDTQSARNRPVCYDYQYRYRLSHADTWTGWKTVAEEFLPPPNNTEIRNYNSREVTDLYWGDTYEFEVRTVRGGPTSESVSIRATTASRRVISIEAVPGSVTEGEPVRFTVSRHESFEKANGRLSVLVTVSETGEMIKGGHNSELRNVEFADGQTTAELVVETVDDGKAYEPDSEVTATVRQSNVHPYGYLYEIHGSRGSARKTVTARSQATGSSVLSVEDAEATEGKDETVSSEGNPGSEVTVDYGTEDGTATADLTAEFRDLPEAHDGESAFTFRIAFSEPLSWMNGRRLREDVVAVAGGRATKASRVNRRRDLWQLTVEPHSPADVTVTLAAGAACGTPTAVCTKDGQALSETISATVAGPPASAPAKPTGLEATATHGSVTLTWDDPGDDSITGYVILRRVRVNDTGGDFDVLVADTGTAATTYTDNTVAASTTYTYRIKAINGAGTSERSRWFHIDTPAAPASKPAVADGPPGLAPNAPNPFNANTLIPYRLDADGPVRLEIYNLLGQSMRTLVDQYQDAGFYKVRWDARDRRGALVSAGMYLVRLHYPGGVQTQRLLYLK